MPHVKRPLPFVLVSSEHGTLIMNRNDYAVAANGGIYGAGIHLLTNAALETLDEMAAFTEIMQARRKHFGDGAVILDCGANIGVYAIEFARMVHGWGHVYAFEAQEKIFYALAGNIIMNNYLNVTARYTALGRTMGSIKIPELDYTKSASFGSFELKPSVLEHRDVGQHVDYANPKLDVPMITLDSLNLSRVDLLKIDVEGMEADVLEGAKETLARCKPVLFVEVLKSDAAQLTEILKAHGYKIFQAGMNVLAFHTSDPSLVDMNLAA